MSVSSESLNPAGQTVLGTVSSLLVNGALHPISTVKNRLMANPELSIRQAAQPKGIYHGFQSMFATDAVVFAVGFFVEDTLKKYTTPLIASIGAGICTVPFVSIGEGVTAARQVTGKSYSEIFRRSLRPAGFMTTLAREVPFWIAVCNLSPWLETKIEQILPESILTEGIAGAVSGAVVGYATVPIDLIKTRVQTYEDSLSIRGAVRSAFAEGGLKGLWRGASARSLYVGLTTSGMYIVKQTLPAYLPERLHADE